MSNTLIANFEESGHKVSLLKTVNNLYIWFVKSKEKRESISFDGTPGGRKYMSYHDVASSGWNPNKCEKSARIAIKEAIKNL